MTDHDRDNDGATKGGGPTPPADEARTTDLGPLPAPTELAARYDLLEEIGRGGMGIVYKARDRETGDVVALKVLQPEINGRPELIERFKSELLLARKITHKNVCRTHELLRFGSTVAIAMEYVEGESLRPVLSRRQGVSLRYGLGLLRQVLAGLAEAHAQGVVHRDLKPENILIARDGTVKVMDFGIARSLETGAMATGTIIGTPAYMSPEQAEGKPADARSDIYSLGLIMYEVFTGGPAFRAETPVALAMKQVRETPPLPRERDPHLPVFLDRSIQKCLEKKPERRFQSVKDLEAALSEQGEPKVAVAGEEVELPQHLVRWQRSDWWLVFAAVAGLAIFFPSFNRTSLAPRSQVAFDRSVLRKIAADHAQRLGAPVGRDSEIDLGWWAPWYIYVAATAGAPAALDLADNPIPCWEWEVRWENGTSVRVDHRGNLRAFSRNFPAGLAVARLSLEEARPLGEKALREFFNRDASSLALEMSTNGNWQWYGATSFTWSDPSNYHGLKRRYHATLVGKEIAHLDEKYDLPPVYLPARLWIEPAWQMLPVLALDLLLLLPLGFSQRRFVDPSARWRKAVMALVFVSVAWFLWGVVSLPTTTVTIVLSIILAVFGGLATALLTFFVMIAIERSVQKVMPAKFSTFVQVFDVRARSEPCGLAILRGTLAGLALMGGDTMLVWWGTGHLPMRLDSTVHITLQGVKFLSSPWPSVAIVLYAALLGPTIMVLISFFASFMARFVRRSWLTVVIAAAAAAACIPGPISSMGAVQPIPYKLLLLFLDCLLLIGIFTRFDVLTVGWTVFTFAFCWENYFLLVIFEPTGALEQWVTFGVFGLFVVAAAAVAFKSPLRQAYGRIAAAFE